MLKQKKPLLSSSGKLIFVDIETGGVKRWPHKLNGVEVPMNPITQIAAVVVELPTLKQVDTFEAKLQFDMEHCDPKALQVNSYDKKVWEETAQPATQACAKFLSFVKRHATVEKVGKNPPHREYKVAALAGYNIASFDLPFIRDFMVMNMGEQFLPIDFITTDVMHVAKLYELVTGHKFKDLKLNTLAECFSFGSIEHDALGDVKATIQVFAALLMGIRGVENESEEQGISEEVETVDKE